MFPGNNLDLQNTDFTNAQSCLVGLKQSFVRDFKDKAIDEHWDSHTKVSDVIAWKD
uniref:Uncharacterized protein n=1 Tax=Candidatus Kentrum sp. TUN TaxID=2126343 RepID=A0A450ZKZ1_9GAMM|nr:MAG: hypothetical protein BECKTUN1418E_GA0071001_100523 [Candidatus Kentron sp. TUN]VFK51352.1 MAG: hypothetical protein BECKTUN1418D_GA0071000_100722 [Candidatus Kentron sp. TUN]VFK54479.1 MAG: hypothetical protein BECKTUN1418F_GA0071002_104310 [Candidatus Kentron sp. TUN]